MKHLFILLSILLLFTYPLFGQSNEKCYVVVESSKDFDPSLLSNISISLISKFVRDVEQLPPSGISLDSCQYNVSVSKNDDTTFVTFKGEGLNSYGDLKLTGSDGFQQSILKSLYRALKDKRDIICKDYGTLLEECGKTIVSYREKGILFDIGVDEWKWIVNGDEKTDGKYEGEIKNGKPDGKGYFSKPKWGSFDGRWSDGNPSQGTEKWYNGNEYSGEYNKNGIHGQGTFTWSDGGKYVGEWKDDKRTGQGTFTYPNGDKYIGEFKDNKMNGQGTFTTSDGDSFRGSWKDDNFQEGVFKSSEGSIFSGEMRHQLPWNGIQYDKNGNFVRRFKNGKKGY